MRRLIVNADDFGFTAGINRAIVEAHIRGIVTSSTLMANGRAFEDAVSLAATVPDLSVGCHVVLIDGAPVLDAELLPSITTSTSSGSRFRDGLKSFAARFSAPVFPGETIRTEMWRDGNIVSFRARVVERDVVAVNNGQAEVRL